MRDLTILFQSPGMIEIIASEPENADEEFRSTGYANSVVPDLLADRDADTLQPYAWMCYNFERTYPLVIWGLKLFVTDELFNVPQAGLSDVPLHEAFSWAYHYFILEDGVLLSSNAVKINNESSQNYTRVALGHALAST